ncbi:MAG: hypothetical protein AAFV07_21070, partial [Bacteroidota bacterium]
QVKLDWTHPTPHLTVPVLDGFRYGALDQWYVDWEVVDIAHELGHAFGLVDEYRDPDSTLRDHLQAVNVWQDHSLMGHYRKEGIEKAALRIRHGEKWANWISEVAEQVFTVRSSPYYLTCEGDTLGKIAARLLGDDRKRYDLSELNESKLGSIEVLPTGIRLLLSGDE